MTPSQLKSAVQETRTDSHFFDRDSMKFFGDRMGNYGVRSAIIKVYNGQMVDCWELYRKKPVKNGLQKSAYFDKTTFKQLYLID